MKKIKKVLLFITIFAISFGFFQMMPFDISYKQKDTTNAATSQILNYVTLTNSGNIISEENMVFENNTIYIMTNESVTINLEPLKYRYFLDQANENYEIYKSNFHKTVKEYKVTKYYNEDRDKFNYEFTYNQDEVIYFSKVKDKEYYEFFDSPNFERNYKLLTNSLNDDCFEVVENNNNVTSIKVLQAYTLTKIDKANPVEFEINIYQSVNHTSPIKYKFIFMQPIYKFVNAINPIVSFSTYKNFDEQENSYKYSETDNWLQREQTFNYVNLTFLCDKYQYTKDNPLYFNINFSGFTYEYTLYTENGYLFVIYVDEINYEAANNKYLEAKRKKDEFDEDLYIKERNSYVSYLATRLDYTINDEPAVDTKSAVRWDSKFSMLFDYRGRYEIEFYDKTYVYGFKNANYYSTSFYIINSTSSSASLKKSLFDNIYILSQSIDENNEPIEYIVDHATLNTNAISTIKNLSDFSLSDDELLSLINISDKTLFGDEELALIDAYVNDGEITPEEKIIRENNKENNIEFIINNVLNFESINEFIKAKYSSVNEFILSNIISKIEVKYTKFGNSDNEVKPTVYTPKEVAKMIEENGEFSLSFNMDGYYQIAVYDTNENYEEVEKVEYNFTIVKLTKTSYTVEGYDTYEEKTPYHTTIKYYQLEIRNNDPIRFCLAYNNGEKTDEVKLNITYINEFSITFGVQLVNANSTLDEENKIFYINFLGVGDLTVVINVNGTETTYNLNSEKSNGSLQFTDYGEYNVTLTDSMGTSLSKVFSYEKEMNTSTKILIGASIFITLVILIFVISARGRIRTR